MLMPVLGFVRAPNVDEAIHCAVRVEHGYGHTSVMHSTNITALSKMARAANTSIFVKNALSAPALDSTVKALHPGRLPARLVHG